MLHLGLSQAILVQNQSKGEIARRYSWDEVNAGNIQGRELLGTTNCARPARCGSALFFNDFILKMFTVVGLQASIKTNACFYVNGLFYLVGILQC